MRTQFNLEDNIVKWTRYSGVDNQDRATLAKKIEANKVVRSRTVSERE